MTGTNADKAGSVFLQLPREIRDEIYGHYFSKSYRVLWSLPEADGNESFFRNVPNSKARDLADFAILRTCKSIKSDAQNILYSKGTNFVYSMRFDYCALHTKPPSRKATNRMMNVEFKVRVFSDAPTLQSFQGTHDHEQHQLYSRMEATCGATLDRFAGTSVIRDSFRITFEIGYVKYNNSIGHLIGSPFFQTLEDFTGFQKLTVGLISAVLADDAPNIEARDSVRRVQKALKPHLGPSIVRSENSTIDRFFGFMKYFSVEIEFEPRKFHIEKLRGSKL